MKKYVSLCAAFCLCFTLLSWSRTTHHTISLIVQTHFAHDEKQPATVSDTVSSKDVAKYVGKVVTTSGQVVTTRLIESNDMTLLNVGAANPDQDFTIMIRSENRSKFGQPEVDLKGKTVTVTGLVIDYKGKPEIEITDPKQLVAK